MITFNWDKELGQVFGEPVYASYNNETGKVQAYTCKNRKPVLHITEGYKGKMKAGDTLTLLWGTQPITLV
jgi:hypothetical protein